jgi:hypothetical protein
VAAQSQGNGSVYFFAAVCALFGAITAYQAGKGAVRTFQTRRLVREAPRDTVEPANDDRPVVVRADLRAQRHGDPEYGVEADAAFLVRLDETFESYSTGGKNSRTAHRWGGPKTEVLAGDGQLTFGAYRLSKALVAEVPTTADVPLTEDALAKARTRSRCTLVDGRCYTGDPHAPKVGDHRVAFRVRSPGPAALLAEQINGCCLRRWTPPIGGSPIVLLGPVNEPLERMLDRVAKQQTGFGTSLLSLGLFVLALGIFRISDHFPRWLAWRLSGMRALNHVLVPLGLTITIEGAVWARAFPRLGVPILAAGLLLMAGPLLIARRGSDTLAE